MPVLDLVKGDVTFSDVLINTDNGIHVEEMGMDVSGLLSILTTQRTINAYYHTLQFIVPAMWENVDDPALALNEIGA